MNSIQMCLFPLDNGNLINVNYIFNVVPRNPAKKEDGYWINYENRASQPISVSEYERLKQLYCPPTQNIL